MAAPETAEAIRDVNTRYHDGAASDYDAKWGIDWGEVGRAQVLGKVEKALGGRDARFARALEVGAGTGYFSLHLLMAGIVGRATCTDISPGMIDVLRANAARLGLDVDARVADAEALPFEDASFDLVLGHAVLHHLPDLDRAFAEFHRVLRPGGVVVFAGEPSRYGDRIATVHAFVPGDLAGFARRAGFDAVDVRGEELLANWFGWTNRALEATAVADEVPMAWKQYAFRGYLALQKVDRGLLEGRLPAAVFYNLLLSARKPG